MLKEQPVVTESARKSKFIWFLIVFLIIALFVSICLVSRRFSNDSPKLSTPSHKLNIEIASNDEARQLGLSGRKSLSDMYGMIFVFDEPTAGNCFWMKDMNFAIDMVWLDEQKRVITVKQNIAPDTYPTVFCPDGPAKYGLEIKANSAVNVGITTGATLRF